MQLRSTMWLYCTTCAFLVLAMAAFLSTDAGQLLYLAKFVPPVLFVLTVRSLPSIPRLVWVTWSLWIMAQLASVFVSKDIESSLLLIGSYVVFLAYVATLSRSFSSDALHFLVFISSLGVLVVSFLFIDSSSWTAFGGRSRFRGGFNNANALGQFAAMAIYAGVSKLRQVRKIGSKLVMAVILCLLAVLLYYSGSRAAMLFLMIALIPPMLHLRIRSALILAAIISVVLCSLPADSLPDLDTLSSYRLSRWEARISEAVTNSPLLGMGLSGEAPVDNSFVSMFVQSGPLGFVFGLLFTVAASVVFLRVVPAPTRWLWIAWLGYGLLENMWYSLGNPLSVYVWTLMLVFTLKHSRETVDAVPRVPVQA